MADRSSDPYRTLGVDPSVSDADLHAAYRRLVKRHHPDHNGGSAESAQQFEAVQEAYARAQELRRHPRRSAAAGPGPGRDPDLEARLADLEQKLQAAKRAAEAAGRAARDAVRPPTGRRPSDEELGYFKTEDSFSKILADAASELSGRLSSAHDPPVVKRIADLIDEFGSKLSGKPPSG